MRLVYVLIARETNGEEKENVSTVSLTINTWPILPLGQLDLLSRILVNTRGCQTFTHFANIIAAKT